MIATMFTIASREARSRMDRLNETRMSFGHVLALASALRNSIRSQLVDEIAAFGDANEMSGATLPRTGLSHRASASKATVAPRSTSTIG